MRLKIAIQKSGRLLKDSLQILQDCDITIDNEKEQLKIAARNFPLEVLYLKNGDIPQYLQDGVVDISIIGSNLLVEKGGDIKIIENLGFSKCRLSIAIPESKHLHSLEELNGKQIATSYPNTVKRFLEEKKIQAHLHLINGSVEITPNIGMADAIVDIVSSGNTLFKNNLKEVMVILESQAVLACSPKMSTEKQTLLNKLHLRIKAVLKARNSKYILFNIPDEKLEEVVKLLPGLKSPTIVPLAKKKWSAVHSVINKYHFWEMIDKLKENGAEGILVCPIEKMML